MAIERDGDTVAKVHKALAGIRDRFHIDLAGGELRAKGNFVDHEYEVIATATRLRWCPSAGLRVRETYGVEIGPGEDAALMLAIVVCIDTLRAPRLGRAEPSCCWWPPRPGGPAAEAGSNASRRTGGSTGC